MILQIKFFSFLYLRLKICYEYSLNPQGIILSLIIAILIVLVGNINYIAYCNSYFNESIEIISLTSLSDFLHSSIISVVCIIELKIDKFSVSLI